MFKFPNQNFQKIPVCALSVSCFDCLGFDSFIQIRLIILCDISAACFKLQYDMSSRYLNCVAVLVSVSLHLLDHRLYTKASDGLFPCVQICAKCSDKTYSLFIFKSHKLIVGQFYDPFWGFVCNLHKYLSQNLGADQ